MASAAVAPPPDTSTPAPIYTGLRGLPLVRAMLRDPRPVVLDAWRRHGDVVQLRLGGLQVHLAVHPESVHRVLHDRNKYYSKGTRGFRALSTVLGNGLLTSEGDFWRRQRRIAQPAFHRDRIAGFAELMVRRTDRMLERWEQSHVADRSSFDVAEEMMRLTLGIVAEALFSAEVDASADTVYRALGVILSGARRRLLTPAPLTTLIPTPSNRRFDAAVRQLDEVVYGFIERRRRTGEQRDDLLGMLMAARDEDTGETMTDRQLRDEVMTIFLAGHETTANALSWTFYLLSRHPDVGRRLTAELAPVCGRRLPTLADVPELPLTARVIDESMRLYPPAWVLSRMAEAPDVLGGHPIPRGSMVMLSPYLTHRHPEIWDNPEGFDPDRFEPERVAELPRSAYFPFGGGPRRCIGSGFAELEARLILATVWSRYRLDLVPGWVATPTPMITLRPGEGVRVTARPA